MPKKPRDPATTIILPGPSTKPPMPVNVQEDDDLRPVAVSLEGKSLEVVSIDERVAEEAEWWEPEPVFKMHYQVTLENGRYSSGT